jgi:hypothetical protein
MFLLEPVLRVGHDKFNLALGVVGSSGNGLQNPDPLPLGPFSPGPAAAFVVVGPMVRMKRGKDIADLFFDVCAVTGAHELFRSRCREFAGDDWPAAGIITDI